MTDYYDEQARKLQEQHLEMLNTLARNQRIEGMESQFAGSNQAGFLIQGKSKVDYMRHVHAVNGHLKDYNYQKAATRAAAYGYEPDRASAFGSNAVALWSGVGMFLIVYVITGLPMLISGIREGGTVAYNTAVYTTTMQDHVLWFIDMVFIHWCLYVMVRAAFIATRIPAGYQTYAQNRKVRMRYLLLPFFLYWPVHITLTLMQAWDLGARVK